MTTPRFAQLVLLAFLAAATPATAQVCEPCQNDIDILVEVPVVNKNYAGPTKFEGDIWDAFGKTYSVDILIDGTLKPVVSQFILNPGQHQFIRWTTAAIKLPNGPHTLVLTITDLAQPSCPAIRTIHFKTFGNN